MARAAPARGLAELFLITYFELLYAQILHYTILIPFLRILIINIESNYYVSFFANNNMDDSTFILPSIVSMTDDSIWTLHLFDCESPKRLQLKEAAYHA